MDKWLILAKGKCPHCGEKYEALVRQSVFNTYGEKFYNGLKEYAHSCYFCGERYKVSENFTIYDPPIVKRVPKIKINN